RHGYGVLLYDARGRGRSEGTQNSFGWGWGHDVSGAVRFLKTRPEVDPHRIGGLGLSTGADVLVEAAGEHDDLRAVVADGTAAGSFEDWRRLQGITGFTPFLAAEFATIRLTSGAKSGPPLEEMVRHGHAPLLLVSSGRDVEYDFNVHYDEVAGDRDVAHWNLPHVGHTGALHQAPRQYEQRVTAFFDAKLR
ncbi:MAG TPA: CocE/NonD family hydrolase, partial [Solirubrobacter sp.]